MGVPAWNEAGPVNRNRNLRFAVDVSGVPLIYDSERTTIATPYGGAGWSLGLGTSEVSGTTVVIDDAGIRSSFTESAGAFQAGPFEQRMLVRTSPDTYELRSDGGVARVFSGGREVALRDRHGVARTWSYDGQGRLTQIASPRSGDAVTLAYDGDSRLVTVASGGLTQTIGYDEAARLISVSSPTTGMPMPGVQIGYGGNGRVATMTNRAGETTSYTYAADGGLDTVQLPDSLSVRTTCEVDDTQRLVLRSTDSFGDSVAQVHDANGSVAATWDAYGNQTSYTRDAQRRVIAVTADGQTSQFVWNATGDLASTTTAGQTISYAYDAAHRPTTITDALGRTSTYVYGVHGLVVQATDGFGRVTTWERNASGDVTRVRTPDGLSTSFTYDGVGRTTSQVAPDGRTTHYAWTAAGDLSEVTFPDGTSERWSYASDHRVLSHTDRLGRVSSLSYDADRRPSSVSLPGGRSVEVGYDATGRVAQRNLRLGPIPKTEATSYGMYGEIATRSINGILSQSAPRTHVPLMPFMGGGVGPGQGPGSGMPGPGSGSGSGSADVGSGQ